MSYRWDLHSVDCEYFFSFDSVFQSLMQSSSPDVVANYKEPDLYVPVFALSSFVYLLFFGRCPLPLSPFSALIMVDNSMFAGPSGQSNLSSCILFLWCFVIDALIAGKWGIRNDTLQCVISHLHRSLVAGWQRNCLIVFQGQFLLFFFVQSTQHWWNFDRSCFGNARNLMEARTN